MAEATEVTAGATAYKEEDMGEVMVTDTARSAMRIEGMEDTEDIEVTAEDIMAATEAVMAVEAVDMVAAVIMEVTMDTTEVAMVITVVDIMEAVTTEEVGLAVAM
jgi:hypothetical protein